MMRDQRGIVKPRLIPLAMLCLTFFFESVCFPTVVALGIHPLGRHYKRGSGFNVGAVCGGAVVPPIMGHVADLRDNTGYAMIAPTLVCWRSFSLPCSSLGRHLYR